MTERSPKIGLLLPMFSGKPETVLAAARSADELGFDGVFAFDHFFPPGAAPDRPSLEAFTTLGAVAATTRRVAIGTLVTRAVLRPPGMLAKLAATLDQVSDGRMILGIGTGDPIDRPEHDRFGFPNLSVAERRAHLNETVRALQALFRGESFEGADHVGPIEGPLLPAPVQNGGPPIWIGAQADPLVTMAADIADGWNGWGMEPAAFRAKTELLHGRASNAGRRVIATWAGIVLVGEDDADAQRLMDARRARGMSDGVAWAGGADAFVDHLRGLREAGAEWVVFVLAGPAGRRELLAERVLPALGS